MIWYIKYGVLVDMVHYELKAHCKKKGTILWQKLFFGSLILVFLQRKQFYDDFIWRNKNNNMFRLIPYFRNQRVPFWANSYFLQHCLYPITIARSRVELQKHFEKTRQSHLDANTFFPKKPRRKSGSKSISRKVRYKD